MKKRLFSKAPYTSAVILAAGSGLRFGGDKPKQYVDVAGMPAVVRSALAFQQCDLVQEIILVSRPGDEDEIFRICSEHGIDKVKAVVPGGATRQESSLKGVESISENSKYVAVHDAARCLITPEMVEQICLAAYDCGAAAAAHRATDTVKICGTDGTVSETVDRNSVWLAATPQIFKTNIYLASAYIAIRDKAEVTDDCMMAERLGFTVKMVECGGDNIKLTGPEDLAVAEGILSRRRSRDASDMDGDQK